MNCSVEVKQIRAVDKTVTEDWGTGTYEWRSPAPIGPSITHWDDVHAIPQGTGVAQRIGRSVNVLSDIHRCRMRCLTRVTAGQAYTFHIRCVVVFFTVTAATSARINETNATHVFESTDRMMTYMNPNLHGYRKVFDKVFTMSKRPDATSTANLTYPNELYFSYSLGKYLLRYKEDNTTGLLADGVMNGYYQVFFYPDEAVDMQFTWDSRVKFTDQ